MLTTPEKILFTLLTLVTLYLAYRGAQMVVRVVLRGDGEPDYALAIRRAVAVLLQKTVGLSPTFQTRPTASLFHGLVAWGFFYFALVNLGDLLQGYIPDYRFMGQGMVGDLYRLGSDLFSLSVLVGMTFLMVRRFIFSTETFAVREGTTLHPKAIPGMKRDSLIVGAFILLHVGFRLIGESFHVAQLGGDSWQPAASLLAGLWSGWGEGGLEIGRHVGWWVSLGLILAFIPYFPRSKHLHLFAAPLNYLLKPEWKSIGELEPLDFEDPEIEIFGVSHLEHLSYSGLLDAYACIMCNRCQDACPAYATGKVLSPAAMEINKRYKLNEVGPRLAQGEGSDIPMVDFAISPEAIWACTACGACTQICPVGNEPMRDILSIRRSLVLMENAFPEQLQTAYRGMERSANPWNVSPDERMSWAEGLAVPTVEENPDFELLWWVGCAPATDARAQKSARAFARLLLEAGVNFAVLGKGEGCTGDSARRSGNEYLFHELASGNVETLNAVDPPRIVTTCPHCLHTLKNEYPAFGGHYPVIHHTELLRELMEAGSLHVGSQAAESITFHDPCYLGRHNEVYQAPRDNLVALEVDLREMPRNRSQSFCCGAGGAQMWKEEEEGEERVSSNRVREAQQTGASTMAVGCPFCMIMLTDAAKAEQPDLQIRDVAEILAEGIRSHEEEPRKVSP